MPHILRAQQFDPQSLEAIFRRVHEFDVMLKDRRTKRALRMFFPGVMLFNIFYAESLRTRASFFTAAYRLGMSVFDSQNGDQFSSQYPDYWNRGETLEDSIKVLCTLGPDIIVLRRPEQGAAERAAKVSNVPIINAGDGKGQHPTQAVLDICAIQRKFGTVEGLTVLIGGDLRYGRTARSLAYLLSKYAGVRLIFVAPEELRMGEDVLRYLRAHHVPFSEHTVLEEVIGEADAVYWTRTQRDKMGDEIAYEDVAHRYRIDRRIMQLMKKTAALLHPLPRNDEIDPAIDDDPRVLFFEQTRMSVPTRMALLELALGGTYLSERIPYFVS